ncbi:BTB domain-containing protein [Mycena venus]|uniref:BTB domain-containing protein n=1 Tax=Mycena venus TaxID=2733690 RepID=A0A8H6YJF4_9AGAR|nr:BTB domain-containing protein [Mycena venus]
MVGVRTIGSDHRLSDLIRLTLFLSLEAKPIIMRSEIWYDDGSVVLQAQQLQFRVHWAVLAQHSPFFREMRGLPQPPDQPSVEGCPIVELSDDVVDVEFLLKALYTPTFLCQTALPLQAIAALIRVGRKYEFRELFDLAVARLTFEYPATLDEYDKLFINWRYTPTRIVPHDGLQFDIISLARENNIVSVLPLCILSCGSVGTRRLTGWYPERGWNFGFSHTNRPASMPLSPRKNYASSGKARVCTWMVLLLETE